MGESRGEGEFAGARFTQFAAVALTANARVRTVKRIVERDG